ncbi:MAG: cobalamin-dependent protein [Anaerolineae bacterium]|nr:cobalamin-dependent protein [Anaerolineae bacterium]MCX8067068.1 cobalamin-dependent protein [Anaerolineae bacterium]MDW7990954.1 cobalamin-dependent protein [Anaerolineae bacterium]
MQKLEQLRDAWVAACLAFDEPAAESVFQQALTAFPPEAVCLEVLRAGLAWIGEAWYRGDATVHQEHFASHLAARQVQALLAETPFPAHSDFILIVCPSGEYHAFGPLLLAYLLRRNGWRVVYLGADLPVEETKAAVHRANPRWVVVSAHHLPPVVGIQALGRLLRDMKVPLAYGGRVFNQVPALRSRVLGYFLGQRMEETPVRLAEWATCPPPLPDTPLEDEAIRRARNAFLGQEWDIRARVLPLLSLHPLPLGLPEWLVDYTFSHIRAALILGDITLADAYIDWLRGLRDGLSLPAEWVDPFLEALRRGVRQCLGEEGAPILEWLERQLSNS